MLAAFFLFLAAHSPLAIAHCSDSLRETLRAGISAPGEPVSVTCSDHVILVTARGRHEVFKRDGRDDNAILAGVVRALAVLQLRPMPASVPARIVKAPDPNAPFERGVEIWIEPLGSVYAAGLGLGLNAGVYVAAGVTIDLAPHWELVNSFGFLLGGGGDDDGDVSPYNVWQLWVSAAPVYLWHFNAGGPRSGFFLGPKLTVAIAHADTEYPVDGSGPYPAQTAWAVEIGCEAGVRFQFGHFDLTLTLPSVSVGYEHNRENTAMSNYTVLGDDGHASKDGIGYDTDFNLLRVGVNF